MAVQFVPWWIPVITSVVVGVIMSIPGYLSVRLQYRVEKRVADQAKTLETVHALVNSQSEKLNNAIEKNALLTGEAKGRADATAEIQAGVAVGKDR
jgi:uncharacterized membrane-anchored protein YhcB (DUF1043 family)